jgi:uncharacterized protein YcbK (DUF882 family)
MRDVQAEEVRPIDLRVYYLLAMVQDQFAGRPILITSGYRTETTNEQLRRRGIERRETRCIFAASLSTSRCPVSSLAAW